MSFVILIQRKTLKAKTISNNSLKKNQMDTQEENEYKIKAISPFSFKINEILFVLTNFPQRFFFLKNGSNNFYFSVETNGKQI